jgi:hypothetical protein
MKYICDHCHQPFPGEAACRKHEKICPKNEREKKELKRESDLISLLHSFGLQIEGTTEEHYDNFEPATVDKLLDKNTQKDYLLVWGRHDNGEAEYTFFDSIGEATKHLSKDIENYIMDEGEPDMDECHIYSRVTKKCWKVDMELEVHVNAIEIGSAEYAEKDED